jgi:hypothetical protein
VSTRVWYATREDVEAILGSKETVRGSVQIDRVIAAESESIERDQMHRRFYPEVDTRLFNWPGHVDPHDGSRTVHLGCDELLSITEVKVAGVVIGSTHYTLVPVNKEGPPYTAVELDATVGLPVGVSERRAVQIAGLYGYRNDEEQVGMLAANLAAGPAATASVSWTTPRIGVGDVLRIDNERVIVNNRTMVDSTQNLGGTGLIASAANVTVPVTNGSGFAAGEIILIDSERMLVVDIAANNLIVKRAWDGSVLAVHATNADIYTLTGIELARGQLGTTDTSHSAGAVIYRQIWPPLINQLCIVAAITSIQQQKLAAYGRIIEAGETQREAASEGLEDLRRRAYEAHGRKE